MSFMPLHLPTYVMFICRRADLTANVNYEGNSAFLGINDEDEGMYVT